MENWLGFGRIDNEMPLDWWAQQKELLDMVLDEQAISPDK